MGHCGRCHYCDVTVIWAAIFSRKAHTHTSARNHKSHKFMKIVGPQSIILWCIMFARNKPIHDWVRPAAVFLDHSEKSATFAPQHYTDVIMSTMASQITRRTTLYSNVYWGTVRCKYQSSASLAFVRWPVNSPHKRPITRNMFPFNDVIKKSISR